MSINLIILSHRLKVFEIRVKRMVAHQVMQSLNREADVLLPRTRIAANQEITVVITMIPQSLQNLVRTKIVKINEFSK